MTLVSVSLLTPQQPTAVAGRRGSRVSDSSLQWLANEPLTSTGLQKQRTKQSYKVGREKEGMSSNHPELVALWGCLEAHPDHENLLKADTACMKNTPHVPLRHMWGVEENVVYYKSKARAKEST